MGPTLSPKNFAERLRAQREAAERLIGKRAEASPKLEAGKAGNRPDAAVTGAPPPAAREELSGKSLAERALDKASAATAGMAGATGAAIGSIAATTESLRNEPASGTEATAPAQPSPAAIEEASGEAPQASPPEPAMRHPHVDAPAREAEHAPAAEQAPASAASMEPAAATAGPEEFPQPVQPATPAPHDGPETVSGSLAHEAQAAKSIDFTPHMGEQAQTPQEQAAHGGYGGHDYASAYAELERESPQQAGSGKSSLMVMLGIFIAIAVLAAAAVFLLFRPQQPQTAGEVPVIQPPGTPAKVKPEQPQPAPMQPRRRKLIYDRITDDAADKAGGAQPATPPAATPKPPAAAPTPAPPPLPPPPSMGDDQGQAPASPSPRQQEETRAASGGSNEAVAAGGSELARAARAFANGGANNAGNGKAGGSFAASSTAGSDELANATRTFAHRIEDKGKRVATANTGMATPPASISSRNDARKAADAARRKVADKTVKKAVKKTVETNRASTLRKPPRPPKKPNKRLAKGRIAAPEPTKAAKSLGGGNGGEPRPAVRGPIALPGAVAPVAGTPATTASTGRATDDALRGFASATTLPATRPPAAIPRKRMNFNAGQRLAAPRAASSPTRRVANVAPATTRQAAAAPARQPAAAPTTPARTTPTATGGGYMVQLAAYRSQQDALRAWQRVRARHGAALGGVQPIISRKNLGDAGTFYRLSVGPLPSRAAASRLCQRLIARGEPDCLIRKR